MIIADVNDSPVAWKTIVDAASVCNGTGDTFAVIIATINKIHANVVAPTNHA